MTNARAEERMAPPNARLRDIGAFIWRDGARIRAAALRPGERTIAECRLRGASMAPAIPPRSRIRIVLDGEPSRVGDVVAFIAGGRVVAHRVVDRRQRSGETWLITRGDAKVVPDAPIDAAAVIGRVVQFDAGAGWRGVGPPVTTPRRNRCLAATLRAATALSLEIGGGAARRFIAWLEAADSRYAWTRKLLS